MAVSARLVAAVALTLSLFLSLSPRALAQSLPLPVVETRGDVTVRAESGMRSLARDIANRAPDVLDRIHRDLYNQPVPETIEIRLVKRARDLTAGSPAGYHAPEWASGIAYPDLGVVVVATRSGANSIDVVSVTDHELAHLALGAALGHRAPRWLHEGFAYLHSSDWSLERTRTLTGMVWFGNVIPLRDLEHGFPLRENAASRAYAESYDFVAFLTRRGRYPDRDDDGNRWPFRRFLAEIAGGETVRQAAWTAYGTSLDKLFEEWRIDLKDRYMLMPIGMFAMLVWVIAALLLIVGFIRRRRRDRQILAVWGEEERQRDVLRAALATMDQTDNHSLEP